jgi:hypothetical protein
MAQSTLRFNTQVEPVRTHIKKADAMELAKKFHRIGLLNNSLPKIRIWAAFSQVVPEVEGAGP